MHYFPVDFLHPVCENAFNFSNGSRTATAHSRTRKRVSRPKHFPEPSLFARVFGVCGIWVWPSGSDLGLIRVCRSPPRRYVEKPPTFKMQTFDFLSRKHIRFFNRARRPTRTAPQPTRMGERYPPSTPGPLRGALSNSLY